MIPVENQSKSYDPRESQYFQGLPAFVQESILQSGSNISSDEELRHTAEQLIYRDNFQ